MKYFAFALTTLITLAVLPAYATATQKKVVTVAASNECDIDGHALGFFNGVGNTVPQATDNLARTIGAMSNRGVDFMNMDVRLSVFYNQTNKFLGIPVLDLVEVFNQRAEEAGFNDRINSATERMELFWFALSGSGGEGYFDRLKALLGNSPPHAFLESFREQVMVEMLASTRDLNGTEQIYDTHRAKLQSWAIEGRRMMFAAHSQGNLFVNKAYEAVLDIDGYDSDSIGVVHVAPASRNLSGPYSLASKDMIIGTLRTLQGEDSVPPVNVEVPLNPIDKTGHGYGETYLHLPLPTSDHVTDNLMSVWSGLARPSIESNRGLFTATIVWSAAGDIDLHTYEPDGSHVYYANQTGTSGRLEYDDRIGKGPENYDAFCDQSRVEAGTYRFGVNNFGGESGTSGEILVSTATGEDLIKKSFSVGEVRGSSGDNSPQILGEIEVTKRTDPDDRDQVIFDVTTAD